MRRIEPSSGTKPIQGGLSDHESSSQGKPIFDHSMPSCTLVQEDTTEGPLRQHFMKASSGHQDSEETMGLTYKLHGLNTKGARASIQLTRICAET